MHNYSTVEGKNLIFFRAMIFEKLLLADLFQFHANNKTLLKIIPYLSTGL